MLLDYSVVIALGVVVGSGELVSRYRDAPWSALSTVPAFAYVVVNAVAASTALVIINTLSITFGLQDPAELRLAKVVVAGLGAMSFLRTSLFIVRVQGRDVAVGPATLLQILLFATDRSVDRARAAKRALDIPEAMKGLDYNEIKEALPHYCLTLMQNVPVEEQNEVQGRSRAIAHMDMPDALKVNALGLTLVNVVGLEVLTAAVEAAKRRIIEGGVLGEVWPTLREVCKRVDPVAPRRLDVLGLTLYITWPYIRAWIEEDPPWFEGWTVNLLVLDPEWLRKQGDLFDPEWAGDVQNIIPSIASYVARRQSFLKERNVDIKLKKYGLFPGVHGFRTSNGYYSVSFVHWDKVTGRAAPAAQGFASLFNSDDAPRSKQYTTLFDSWLERVDASATDCLMPPRDP